MVSGEHVAEARKARRRRHSLTEDRSHELISEKVIRVETKGEVVGQVNGLAVYDLGHHRFGKPTRITAQVGLGRDGVINIYGTYSDETEFYFRLEGTGPDGEIKDFVYREAFPSADNGGPEIARQWAFQKIYSMIGEMCLAGESPQGLAMVRSLGEKYSIQTPYYERER